MSQQDRSTSLPQENPYRPYVVPYNTTTTTMHIVSLPGTSSSSARDLLADLDIPTDYLQNPELGEMMSSLASKAASKYVATFIRQPFEIVKTIMQVQHVSHLRQTKFPTTRRWTPEEFDVESDSSDDHPLFSESPTPSPPLPSRGRSRRRADSPTSGSTTSDIQLWELPCNPTDVRSILGALWTKEGAWGIWKGTNSTFVYTMLYDGIETWLGSLLAATFALPDPTLFDMLDSPTPGASLAAALTATAITAFILAPIDIYRITKMILPARSPASKLMPTPVVIPNSLIVPTILHATIPNYLSSLFTLSIRPYFPQVTLSSTYYGLPFLASILDLGIRLPLESILRRAQIAYTSPDRTAVRVAPYRGVIGTTWSMLTEESGGVFRGWRIGFWGLMMVWVLKTTNALGRGYDVEF